MLNLPVVPQTFAKMQMFSKSKMRIFSIRFVTKAQCRHSLDQDL